MLPFWSDVLLLVKAALGKGFSDFPGISSLVVAVGELYVRVVVVEEGEVGVDEGEGVEHWQDAAPVPRLDRYSARIPANYLLVEHVEGLNSPHQQLVPRELVSKAVQTFHLALLVALILWGKYHRNLKKPTLMENLGGAEPVIVGHGPLQCRLEAQGG